MQQPSLGRIVHYKWHEGDPDPTAAMITQSYQADGIWYMWLRLFPAATVESAVVQVTSKDMAEGPKQAQAGQWYWPERL